MYGFNYWNVTNLEKKLMTNFKRIQIQSAIVVIESIFLGIVFYLLIIINTENNDKYGIENVMYFSPLVFIQAFIIAFVFILLINMVLLISTQFIFPKFDYYLEKGEPVEKWYLVRVSQKNQVLLNNRNGKFIFQEGWQGEIFFVEMVKFNKFRELLFKTEKRSHRIALALFIISSIFYFLGRFLEISTSNSLVFFIISTIFIFFAFILEIAKIIVFRKLI